MKGDDPKHTSADAIEDKGINWWQTPPESPDLIPIRNLWCELKEFIRRVLKPRTRERLIDGIKQLWKTVDVTKCQKIYWKVIPTKGFEIEQGSHWLLVLYWCC